MDKISVLMSTYNEPERMLCESIESILKQTYENLELIIVLDHPNNLCAKKVINRYREIDKRVILIENETNLGLALSLNRALKRATGKYVARMDADDYSMPDRLKVEVNFLNKNKYDMVFSERIDIDEVGNELEIKKIAHSSEKYIRAILPYNCVVNHPSILIKTCVIKELGGYRNFQASQDYDLWLRLLTHNYRIGCISDPLIKYRVRKTSISQKKNFIQFETARYIRKLYYDRVNRGYDDYSWNNYIEYLKKKGVFSKICQSQYEKCMQAWNHAMIKLNEKKMVTFLVYFFQSLIGGEKILYIMVNAIREKRINRMF